jgi:hypothetical protein
LQGAAEFVQDGQVTDRGLAALQSQMPYADFTGLQQDRRLNRIDDLFTVGLLSNYVTWKLGGNSESCGDVHSAAPGHCPEDLTISVVSTEV